MENTLSPIITIKDVMQTLFDRENAKEFSITFISMDDARKKGGDIIRLDKAQVPKSEIVKKDLMKPMTMDIFYNKKNPNHRENNTINLIIPGANKIVKVHIDLITEFNTKRVIW